MFGPRNLSPNLRGFNSSAFLFNFEFGELGIFEAFLRSIWFLRNWEDPWPYSWLGLDFGWDDGVDFSLWEPPPSRTASGATEGVMFVNRGWWREWQFELFHLKLLPYAQTLWPLIPVWTHLLHLFITTCMWLFFCWHRSTKAFGLIHIFLELVDPCGLFGLGFLATFC